MTEIFNDIRTAAKTFTAIRVARKAGADGAQISVRPTYTLPVVWYGYWGWTLEGGLFRNREWKAIWDVFATFDDDTQHALTFAPKDGEWPDRCRFWQQHLKPVLPPEQYHQAMTILIRQAIRCVRRRREAAQG